MHVWMCVKRRPACTREVAYMYEHDLVHFEKAYPQRSRATACNLMQTSSTRTSTLNLAFFHTPTLQRLCGVLICRDEGMAEQW
eukprot:42542-Pelagomonas_calceolata.AAC.1